MNLAFDAVPFTATEVSRVRMDRTVAVTCDICGDTCEPNTDRVKVVFDTGHEIVAHNDDDMYDCTYVLDEHEALKGAGDFKPMNDRGFVRGGFKDLYGADCSLQQSSLATQNALWLGISDPYMKVWGPPWKDFEKPEGLLVSSRMHLSRGMVRRLIANLQHWVDTGSLP